jgi:hypothetical protein
MEIFYGIENHYVNVTSICLSKLNHNGIITIPAGDNSRSNHFTDQLFGIHKNIKIVYDNDFRIYDEYCSIIIKLVDNLPRSLEIVD